jgi:hypothetical protein
MTAFGGVVFIDDYPAAVMTILLLLAFHRAPARIRTACVIQKCC